MSDTNAPAPNTTGAKASSIPNNTTDAKTLTANGRTVNVDTDEGAAPPHPAEIKDAPIGNVADALKSTVLTVDAPKEDASEKKRDDDTEQPIESLAALRDYHNRKGTAPSTEQVEEVKKLEQRIASEGAKKVRTNPIEKGK